MSIQTEMIDKILSLVRSGTLDKDKALYACLEQMSEDDIKLMGHYNGFFDRREYER